MTETVRVAIYGRVSTVGHGQDVGLQLEELRSVAAQRGWHVVKEYVDDGVSGSATNRPALDALLADAQKAAFSHLLIWKLDRLARGVSHLLELTQSFQSWGVGLVSVRDPHVDSASPTGRFALQILGAVAELELALTKERVIAGVRRAQRAGRHCGRPKVTIDVRPAVAMLDLGHGLKATAKSLGVSPSTLRRRLSEAGQWPRPGRQGVQKPPAGKGS